MLCWYSVWGYGIYWDIFFPKKNDPLVLTATCHTHLLLYSSLLGCGMEFLQAWLYVGLAWQCFAFSRWGSVIHLYLITNSKKSCFEQLLRSTFWWSCAGDRFAFLFFILCCICGWRTLWNVVAVIHLVGYERLRAILHLPATCVLDSTCGIIITRTCMYAPRTQNCGVLLYRTIQHTYASDHVVQRNRPISYNTIYLLPYFMEVSIGIVSCDVLNL